MQPNKGLARRIWDKIVRETRTLVSPPKPPLETRIESIEQEPENELETITKLLASYTEAKEQQEHAAPAYRPGANWQTLLETEWRLYRDAIARQDAKTLAQLLRNFFRNEALSGFWGSNDMYRIFRDLQGQARVQRADLMMAQYEAWKSLAPATALEELDAPKIGNPWGYALNGCLLYEPVFEYHYQAHYFASLLVGLPVPVVIEIGGGFGGLAYHILKRTPGIKYIGFDLPENTLLQTYYLSCAFPRAKIVGYRRNSPPLDRETLAASDIVLLPNFMLPRLESSTADLIVNVRSLSEMPAETIKEYLEQIDRIGRLWFFHENIFKARGDGLFGIPSREFPHLKNHFLVAASVSRWPRYGAHSAYPCQENLFLHRGALRSVGSR